MMADLSMVLGMQIKCMDLVCSSTRTVDAMKVNIKTTKKVAQVS